MPPLWLSVLSVGLILLLLFVNHLFSYWKRKGIPSVKANPPFGCLGPVVRREQSVAVLMRDIYLNSKERILGLYCLYRPVLLIRDPELVKRILITDFEHFVDRGFPYDEVNDPVGTNLITMPGEQWKLMKPKLSPTFTSGKLKAMFPCLVANALILKEHLDGLFEMSKDVVRAKDLVGYTIVSFLASTFFGFEFDALKHSDHDFVQMGKAFFESRTIRSRVTNAAVFCFPEAFKLFKMTLMPSESIKCAVNLVKSVMNLRQADASLRRNDFMQTLLDLIKDPKSNNNQPMGKDGEKISLEMGTAQAFIFYAAGYETTTNVISFCLYELAKSPEWLGKARNEVDALMKKRQGKIEFEDIVDLKVIDMCVKETLRKYTVAPILNRECTKDYKVPGMDFVIGKGTPIIISNYGMNLDKRFFPNPDVFDPNRFNGETSMDDLPYYPFGAGPRLCIGARLGSVISRVLLCYLIYYYDFTAIDNFIRLDPTGIALMDENGVRLRIKKRVH